MSTPGADLHVLPEGVVTGGAVPDGRPWGLRHWRPLVLVGAATAVALLVQHFVYPAMSWNRDEATYLWQMRALRSGQLLTTSGGFPELFRPWLTGIRDGQFFSQYTLGWPVILLVVDVVFGSPLLVMAIGTALAVLGTYVFTRELTGDDTLSFVAGVLMLASPIVVTQSGTYLGYLFSLGVGLCFGTVLLIGLRRDRPWVLASAGVLLGLLFLIRPYDAVLWAVAIGGYAVCTTWRAWRRQVRATALVFLGFVPFLVLTLVHNRAVTGSFTTFPFTAKEPLDTFGFGVRRLLPDAGGLDYTVREAVKGAGRNFWYLPRFLVGTYLGLVLVFAGLWIRRRDRTTIVLLLIVVAFPLGYFFFWGNSLSSFSAFLSGPVYYLPLYVPACIFIATALLAIRRRPALTVALVAGLAVATVPFLVGAIRDNHRMSTYQEPWQHVTDALPGRPLVLMRNAGAYLLHLDPFSQNGPDLDGRVLYAVERNAHVLDLIAAHPERTPYVVTTNRPELDDAIHHTHAGVPTLTVRAVRVVRGGAITVSVEIAAPSAPATIVVAMRAGDHVEQRAFPATAGQVIATEWTLAPAGEPAAAPGAIPLAGRGRVTIAVGSGATSPDVFAGPHDELGSVYRVAGGALEMLEPVEKTVVTLGPDGQEIRRDVARLPAVKVQLTATG